MHTPTQPDWASSTGQMRPYSPAPAATTGRVPNSRPLSELLPLIAQGDQAAMATLYEAMFAKCHCYASHLLDSADAVEVVLEAAFLLVWQQAGRFDPQQDSVTAWVQVHIRQAARNAGLAPRQAPALLETLAPNSQIATLLTAMNASEREMISMAFFQGASHADMAVRLGLPEAVVRGQLDSAIEVLRKALASH